MKQAPVLVVVHVVPYVIALVSLHLTAHPDTQLNSNHAAAHLASRGNQGLDGICHSVQPAHAPVCTQPHNCCSSSCCWHHTLAAVLSLELPARRQHTSGQRPQLLLVCLVLFCFCAGIGVAAGPVIGLVAQVPPLPCAGQQYTPVAIISKSWRHSLTSQKQGSKQTLGFPSGIVKVISIQEQSVTRWQGRRLWGGGLNEWKSKGSSKTPAEHSQLVTAALSS
jgi:hypothetical protein